MAVLLRDDDVRAWLGASCKPEDATLAAADDVGAAIVVGQLLDCVFGEGEYGHLQPGSPDGDDADRDELRRWATRRRALDLAHAWLAGAARAGTAAEADVATERDDLVEARDAAEADVATERDGLVSSVARLDGPACAAAVAAIARLDGPGRAAAVAAMGPDEAEHVGAAVAVRLLLADLWNPPKHARRARLPLWAGGDDDDWWRRRGRDAALRAAPAAAGARGTSAGVAELARLLSAQRNGGLARVDGGDVDAAFAPLVARLGSAPRAAAAAALPAVRSFLVDRLRPAPSLLQADVQAALRDAVGALEELRRGATKRDDAKLRGAMSDWLATPPKQRRAKRRRGRSPEGLVRAVTLDKRTTRLDAGDDVRACLDAAKALLPADAPVAFLL